MALSVAQQPIRGQLKTIAIKSRTLWRPAFLLLKLFLPYRINGADCKNYHIAQNWDLPVFSPVDSSDEKLVKCNTVHCGLGTIVYYFLLSKTL